MAVLVLTTACQAAARTQEDSRPPSAPTGVTAQAGSATSVHVMWEPASDDTAVTAYEVFRDGRRVTIVPGSRTMVDVDGLPPATTHRFTVTARDAAGNHSAHSAPATAATHAVSPDDRTPPTAPTAVRGTVEGARAVTLTWKPATDDIAVTAYDIYQEDHRVHSVTAPATTARLAALRPGTVYSFTVRARDAAENSSPDSVPVDLTTVPGPGDSVSTAPTALTATPSPGEITLIWTPPRTGAPVKEHQLYLNGEFATTIVWGGPPPTGPATYTFTVTEPPGTRYSVKLRARLPDGTWGDFSAQRTVAVR
nr:fibronectin type III domain-containing protein [Streptomyces sp. TRM64462]